MAAEFYQRVYYQYLSGDAANRAAAALITLKDTMGAAFPQPLPEQILRRADRLMEIREYSRARAEYQGLLDSLVGVARDQARVRLGAADYLAGKASTAGPYLRGLELSESEAAAERDYYLVECARRLNDDGEMMAAIQRLAGKHAKSPWRQKALLSAANRFLLVNRPDDYVPLYRAVYEDFPAEPPAGLAHWKVTFQAYLHDKPDAAALLRDHLRNYPAHSTAGAALYFLGRHLEEHSDAGSARACYQKLSQTFQNTYYALLARGRLSQSGAGDRSCFAGDSEVSGRAEPGGSQACARRGHTSHGAAHRTIAAAADCRAGRPGGCRATIRIADRWAIRRCWEWKLQTPRRPRIARCGS